ncbi:MAG: hypothetical protein J7L11_00980 [Thermoprotei archaeon]|nr:hypothetical protein [Thermoprotei archaeon]
MSSDSVLTATLAVKALDKDRVKAVYLSGSASNKESHELSKATVEFLGLNFIYLDITNT